jgi:hypothetical protein
MGDITRLLRRVESLESAFDSLPASRRPSRASIVGTVFNNGKMPTTVPAFYDVRPTALGGTQGEGNAVSLSPDKDSAVPVLVLGPKVPSVGDNLIAKMVGTSTGAFWVAQRGSKKKDDGAGFPCNVVGLQSAYHGSITIPAAPNPLTLIACQSPPTGNITIPFTLTYGAYTWNNAAVTGWLSECVSIIGSYDIDCSIATGGLHDILTCLGRVRALQFFLPCGTLAGPPSLEIKFTGDAGCVGGVANGGPVYGFLGLEGGPLASGATSAASIINTGIGGNIFPPCQMELFTQNRNTFIAVGP